jgi:GNAT superfamily N-acetyltransferase
MLRPLTIEDIPELSRLAPLFWAEGKLPGGFDPEVFARTWTSLISSGTGHIVGLYDLTGLVGALGYILAPDPNDGATVATEMFWFVDPEYRGSGLRLFHWFEGAAAALGASRLMAAHLSAINGPELKHLYERFGYREVETFYFKQL